MNSPVGLLKKFFIGLFFLTLGSLHSQEIYIFQYTGNVQSITLQPGKYKLEVWGAQGGNARYPSNQGGKGGYAKGFLWNDDQRHQ